MGPEEDMRDAQRLQSLCYGHRLRAGGDPALGVLKAMDGTLGS